MSQEMILDEQGGWLEPYHGQRVKEPEDQFYDDEAMESDVYFKQNIQQNNVANVYVDQDPFNNENLRKETREFARQVHGAIQETQGRVNALVQGSRAKFEGVEARARQNAKALETWIKGAEKHLDNTTLH